MPKLVFTEFDVLIVDPDINSRAKLKTAARAVTIFKAITPVDGIREAQEFLVSGRSCDIIFISNVYGEEAIDQFMSTARSTPMGGLCAYILVLQKGTQTAETVAGSMMTGISGFLVEPYSVDSLKEIAELAEKVKVKEFSKLVTTGAKLIVNTLVKETTRRASLLSLGENAEASDEAKQAAGIINRIPNDMRAIYFESLIETFIKEKAPQAVDYGGASSRVKERLERKEKQETAARMEEELKEEADALGETGLGDALKRSTR